MIIFLLGSNSFGQDTVLDANPILTKLRTEFVTSAPATMTSIQEGKVWNCNTVNLDNPSTILDRPMAYAFIVDGFLVKNLGNRGVDSYVITNLGLEATDSNSSMLGRITSNGSLNFEFSNKTGNPGFESPFIKGNYANAYSYCELKKVSSPPIMKIETLRNQFSDSKLPTINTLMMKPNWICDTFLLVPNDQTRLNDTWVMAVQNSNNFQFSVVKQEENGVVSYMVKNSGSFADVFDYNYQLNALIGYPVRWVPGNKAETAYFQGVAIRMRNDGSLIFENVINNNTFGLVGGIPPVLSINPVLNLVAEYGICR